MDVTHRAMAAAARFARSHASRQLLENERTNCTPAGARSGSVCGSSSPLIGADLARVHGWHASRHGGSGTPRTVSC